MFTWALQGYTTKASTEGKWIVYKHEGDNNVKVGEVAANEHSLSIEKKQYSCSNGYIMTFLPNVCKGEETVCGLTTTFTATGHQLKDDICQMCGHSYFRYHTSDGNKVDISRRDFGANVVSHEVVDGECVIEFDAPITRIPQYAFKTTKLVGELRIPNTVTSIQDYAFNLCTGLTGNLVIPNSVTEIGNNAFYKCTGFNGTLTLSSNLKTIGDNAFYECSGFTGSLTLPNSVTTIGRSAFIFCNSFTNLELPKALSAIPYQAFRNCSGLSGNLVIPDGVTEIGEYAFHSCPGFKGTLKLSSNLKTIGKYAFYSCSGFTKIEFPETMSLNVIPEWTFWGCTSLSGNLVIPNSVTKIGDNAFYNCKGFNGTLTLSNNLKVIGEYAFERCSGFTGNLTLPNSVTTIGSSAFYNCYGFTGNLTLPNSVTTIGNGAFYYCDGFTGDLTIPNSVTTIGSSAFYNCKGFTGNLTIPNSVTTIEESAFSGCTGFTGEVSLPKSLKKIGTGVFSSSNNIHTVKFQSLPKGISGNLGWQSMIVNLTDDSYISDLATGTVEVISYTRTMTSNWGTLVLPYPLRLTGDEPYCLYAIDNMTGDELVLKQLNGEVAAGTPCVVKRNGTESELTFGPNFADLNMAINDQPMDGMKFSGTYWTKDVDNGYIIAKDCFWNVEELKKTSSVKGVKVNPFRAWLDGTSAKAPAKLSMRIDGSTTGIDAIDALNDAEAEYYDLSGKRLDEPQKGVNIVRMKSGKTKKIIIK